LTEELVGPLDELLGLEGPEQSEALEFVEQLAQLEAGDRSLVGDLVDVAETVDQPHVVSDVLRQVDALDRFGRAIRELVHLFHAVDLARDQVPFIEAPSGLHDQRVGVEPQLGDVAARAAQAIRAVVDQELELGALPQEEVVDLLLDLRPHDVVDVDLTHEPLVDEDLADLDGLGVGAGAQVVLLFEGEVEVVGIELARGNEELADPEASIRGEEGDLAFGEVDELLALAVVDDQGAGVLVLRERLENVAQVQNFEVALQRHGRLVPAFGLRCLSALVARRRQRALRGKNA
jgi:hypothetical protein